MDAPHLRLEATGQDFGLDRAVTTVGRGTGVDIALTDPSVSGLHAEIVRRGCHLYASDLGLSSNGTTVNGRPVGQRVLADGDVVSFGSARALVGGLRSTGGGPTAAVPTAGAPELTRREVDVLTALCRPAATQDAFVAPATAREVALELVVTEAAIKQHLLRLYGKLGVGPGDNRRTRLANEVLRRGIVRPAPVLSLVVERSG